MSERATLTALVRCLVQAPLERPDLRPTLLAYFWYETEGGTTELFLQHKNAANLLWSDILADWSEPVRVVGRYGLDYYASCETFSLFMQSFWRWVDRPMFGDWRDLTPNGFLKRITDVMGGNPRAVLKLKPKTDILLVREMRRLHWS